MFKTSQITSFKNALEGISSLVQDASLTFLPEKGIVLREFDKTGKILIVAEFAAESLDSWFFPEKLVVGVDLVAFAKTLKSSCSTDILTVQVSPDLLTVSINSGKSKKVFKLKTLKLKENTDSFPVQYFDFSVIINSSLFTSYCKTLHSNCDKVFLTCSPNLLSFSGALDTGTVEFSLETGRDLEIIVSEDAKEKVTGCYDLRYFLLFSKCSSLSDDTILFVKDDYPLILQYNLQSLGVLKLCLNI
jgi:proliferating cell nuclear antigen PCNA